jgi:hypothetical protein
MSGSGSVSLHQPTDAERNSHVSLHDPQAESVPLVTVDEPVGDIPARVVQRANAAIADVS